MPYRKVLKKKTLLIVSIIFVALNLRGSITSISTFLDLISHDLNLSPGQVGMLTTLPMLIFALFSPVVSSASKKVKLETLLVFALLTMLAGIVTRSYGNTLLLFFGTLLIAVAITSFNVLLPVLVKRDFQQNLSVITALYTLAMGVGSGLSTYMTLPALAMAKSINYSSQPDWALALLSNLLLPTLAIVILMPQLFQSDKKNTSVSVSVSHSYLWREKSAWCISLCLGFNAFMSYVIFAWLPSIVIEFGHSQQAAAAMQAYCQIGTGISGLVILALLRKLKSTQMLAASMPIFTMLSLICLIEAPQYASLWSLLLGITTGGGFTTILALFGLRTHDAHQAATLSGKSQCVGYLLGATGPILIGYLHDVYSDWVTPLVICSLMCLLWTVVAYFAGSSEKIMQPKITLNSYS